MITGISVSVLRPIIEEINNLRVVTSLQIREIAAKATAEFESRNELDTIVEYLAEDGWIKKVGPSAEQGHYTVGESWQLTDEARKFFRIRRTIQKVVGIGVRVVFRLIGARALRKLRKGQSKFRQELLKRYGHRCMVSGCIAEPSLEAAHIEPYAYKKCNSIENGLLLRADIHSLFDKLLISVNPDTLTVVVSRKLSHTEYSAFQGIELRLHSSLNRDMLKEKLQVHFDAFKAN